MTLTVPDAGTSPGVSAAVRIEAPTGFGSIAQLGQEGLQIGAALEQERLSRQLNRARVDLVSDLTTISRDLDQIGDPDVLEATWAQRRDDLRQQYLDAKNDAGLPRISPQNVEQFNLVFDDMVNAHSARIGHTALANRFARREADYIEYEHTASVAAVQSDVQGRASLLDNGYEIIEQDLAIGRIDEAEAARRKLVLAETIDRSHAVQAIDTDPEGFLLDLEAGEYPGLPVDTAASYRSRAQSAIDQRDATTLRAAELAASQAQAAADDRIQNAMSIIGDGMSVADIDDLLDDPLVQASSYYPQLQAKLALVADYPALAVMTPDDLATLAIEEQSRPVSEPFETERARVISQLARDERAAWEADPIGHAVEKGLIGSEPLNFDPQNPGGLTAALSARAVAAQSLVQAGYTRNSSMLSVAERDQLRQLIEGTQSPIDRAALAASMAKGLTTRPDVYQDLMGDDVVLGWVGNLVNAGGHTSLAATALRGQEAIKAGTLVMPSAAERVGPAFDVVSDLFADIPGGAAMQSTVMETASAIYADRVRRSDPTADIDEGRFRQAVHEAMGGTGSWDSSAARGGIQDVNGGLTMLPMGVGSDQVEEALSALVEIGRQSVTLPMTLQAVSITGQAPLAGGETLDWRDLDQMQIRAVADGIYEFVYIGSEGMPVVPMTAEGEPYRFDLHKLMQVTR